MSAGDPYGDISTYLTGAAIAASVRQGLIVNDTGPDGEPLRASTGSDSDSASVYDETDIDARIDANVLVDALTALSLDSAYPPHPAGLVIRKTVIEGNLDLSRLTLDFPLRFDGCVFTGWINLDYATLAALSLSQCAFEVERQYLSYGAINGRSVTVRHGLDLFGIRGLRQLFIVDSTIGEMSFTENTIADISSIGYRFHTVLDGTSIERLFVDTEQAAASPKLRIPPLGEPSRLIVGSLQTGSSPDKRETVDPKRIAAWIRAGSTGERRETGYSRQVWEAFAQALDRDAMDSEATKLRILGRRFGRTKKRNPFAKSWDWILDATIGYGYANFRAFLIWLALLAVTVGVTAVSRTAGVLAYSGQDLSSPGAIILYSLTVVLSPIGTGGPQDWFFSGAPVLLALALSAMKIASIILLGLFVSGVAGIVNRK